MQAAAATYCSEANHDTAVLGVYLRRACGHVVWAALAMIFVEPYWITPEFSARSYVAIAGIAGAMLLMAIRNQFVKRGKLVSKETHAQPTSPDEVGGR